MVQVNAFVSVNFLNFNLSFYGDNFWSFDLNKNSYISHEGRVYQDTYYYNGYDGTNDFGLVGAGTNISLDSDDFINGGMLNYIGEFDWNSEYLFWSVSGLSLGALAVENATWTSSTADDLALLENALSGNDIADLSDYDDTFAGYDGDDTIRANSGDDEIWGDAGDDLIYAGFGDDDVTGGLGTDRMFGDVGADHFYFDSAFETARGFRRDIISDFSRSEGDLIVLENIDANLRKFGDQDFRFIGKRDFTGTADELRFEHGIIAGDINGDGRSDFEIKVLGSSKMYAFDFDL